MKLSPPIGMVAPLAFGAAMFLGACMDDGFVLTQKIPGMDGSTAMDGATDASSPSCAQYTPGVALTVCTAGYLGGTGENRPTAVAITPAGSIVVAGTFSDDGFRGERTTLPGGTTGGVLVLSSEGRAIRASTRIGTAVYDMAVNDVTGDVAVGGDFGVALLSADAKEEHWRASIEGGAIRVDIGHEGTVAALTADGTVRLFDRAGDVLLTMPTTDATVSDIAVDDASGLFFLVGANQPGGSCTGSMPFLRGYGVDGEVRFRNYDFPDAEGQCASSRGVRVAMGRDGKLYYAGENHGGNTVHLRDPQDLASPARLVSYDTYTAGHHPAIREYTFVARFEPATGEMELGQVLLPRDDDGTGGMLFVHTIAADEHGNVYVGGRATCCLARRDELRISGIAPGTYRAGDNSLAILSPDFRERLTWTTFTLDNESPATTVAVAVGRGLAAMLADQPAGAGRLITVDAIASDPPGTSQAFLATFRAPGSAPSTAALQSPP